MDSRSNTALMRSTQPPPQQPLPAPPQSDKTALWVVLGLFLTGVMVILWPHIFIAIHPGEAGVVWRRFGDGTNLETSYDEGTVIVWPWNTVYIYDLTIQDVRVSAPVYTSDGMQVEVSVSGRVRPNRERLPYLHREVGPDYLKKLIEPELITAVRTVIGKYDSKQVYANGEAGLLEEIRAEFQRRLETTDVDYDDVLLVKLLIPELVQTAIQTKLAVEQDSLSYEFKLEREQQEKQRRTIEAEGIANFEAVSGLSILHWRALEATAAFARSPNAKLVIVGNDAKSLPVVLNADLQQDPRLPAIEEGMESGEVASANAATPASAPTPAKTPAKANPSTPAPAASPAPFVFPNIWPSRGK